MSKIENTNMCGDTVVEFCEHCVNASSCYKDDCPFAASFFDRRSELQILEALEEQASGF